MKHLAILTAALAICGLVHVASAQEAVQTQPATVTTSPAVMLEKGIYNEETAGDLDAAIKIYQQIVTEAQANKKYAAQAQYRLAMCYLKKKENAQAITALKEVVASFPDQKDLVAKAQEQLTAAKGSMSDAEVAKIVADVVTEISTMADGDPRIPPLLQSLRELKQSAALKVLATYFDSEKNTVRRAAIYAVWKGGFSDPGPAVPGLIKLCSHQEDLTRGMAAIALGGLKVQSAFDAIADMTANDKSPFARRAAAYALGLLGDVRAIPVLQKALKDPETFVRNNAEAALTMLAKAAAASGEQAPRIIKTFPAEFANDVDPATTRLSVTFDQKMMDNNWSWVQVDKDTFPHMTGKASFDQAMTTNSAPVKLEPGKVYYIEFNTPPFNSFKSDKMQIAVPHALLFATKSADGKPTPLPEGLVKRAKEINAAADARPPQVVKTVPSAFANDVDASLDRVSVTFDQKMTAHSWAWMAPFTDNYPKTTGEPTYDQAKTTCSLPVKLEPGRVYYMEFNGPPPYQAFRSENKIPAVPHALLFATKSADGKPTPLPDYLIKRAKALNAASQAGVIASSTAQLKDNWAFDLDTNKELKLEREWPDAYDVGWDNDFGGVIMIKPKSEKVHIMAIPEANNLEDAVRKALEPDMQRLLTVSEDRGVPAKRSRFVAVLTDKGQLAVIEIIRFTKKEAEIRWAVGSAEVLREQMKIEKAPTSQAAGESWSEVVSKYYQQGEYDKAIFICEKWLKNDPASPEAKDALKKAQEADKALLASVGTWLGLLDRGEYEKAWESTGPTLRTMMKDKSIWVKLVKPVREDITGKLKVRKLYGRQSVASIPGLSGGPFLGMRYDTTFEKEHFFENVLLQKDERGAWGVIGYTIKPFVDIPKEATAAADQWVKLIDNGDYDKSYDQATAFFRKAVTKSNWASQVKDARSPLGSVKSRKLLEGKYRASDIDAEPDMNSVDLEYETNFEKKDKAVETVSLSKEADGAWRVAGYYIK